MDLATAASVLAAIATLVAAVAAWGSWRAATAANQTAANSARTAQTLATLEREIHHARLTPTFRFTFLPGVGDVAQLTMELVGNTGLDAVTVTIRDDMTRHATGHPAGLTEPQIRQQVWGPYRLRPGVGLDGVSADQDGRQIGPFPMPPAEPIPLWLERTTAPAGQDTGAWRAQYDGAAIRVGHPLCPCRPRPVDGPRDNPQET